MVGEPGRRCQQVTRPLRHRSERRLPVRSAEYAPAPAIEPGPAVPAAVGTNPNHDLQESLPGPTRPRPGNIVSAAVGTREKTSSAARAGRESRVKCIWDFGGLHGAGIAPKRVALPPTDRTGCYRWLRPRTGDNRPGPAVGGSHQRPACRLSAPGHFRTARQQRNPVCIPA